MTPTKNDNRLDRGMLAQEAALLLIYWAAAYLFRVMYVQNTQEYVRSTLSLLTAFRAARPFQYRILLPLIVHGWQAVAPVDLHTAYQFLTTWCVFALFLAFSAYLSLFLPPAWCRFGTLALLYPLFWNYCVLGTYYYASDIPAILFFVVGLICLYLRRWGWFYPVFVLAALNRETSVFLIVAFAVTQLGRQRLLPLAGHLAAQAALWLGVKAILTRAFASSPGQPVFENHFRDNMGRLLALAHGDPHMVQVATCTFGGVWVLIPLFWRQQPAFLRRLLWVVVPFLAGMTVVGNLDEVRIYNELIPVLLAPALFSLYHLFARPAGPEQQSNRSPVAGAIPATR